MLIMIKKESIGKGTYSSVVGFIMYPMVCIRSPDLAHAISSLSRYMSNPDKDHWLAMKWLLRYIGSTIDVGLVYTNHGNEVSLKAFVDSYMLVI